MPKDRFSEFSLTTRFRLSEWAGRCDRKPYRIILKDSKEYKLRKIADGKPDNDFSHGIDGALEVFDAVFNPSVSKLKAMAAECLLAHRECRKTLLTSRGKIYLGTYWLERAAINRQRAMNLINTKA